MQESGVVAKQHSLLLLLSKVYLPRKCKHKYYICIRRFPKVFTLSAWPYNKAIKTAPYDTRFGFYNLL